MWLYAILPARPPALYVSEEPTYGPHIGIPIIPTNAAIWYPPACPAGMYVSFPYGGFLIINNWLYPPNLMNKYDWLAWAAEWNPDLSLKALIVFRPTLLKWSSIWPIWVHWRMVLPPRHALWLPARLRLSMPHVSPPTTPVTAYLTTLIISLHQSSADAPT